MAVCRTVRLPRISGWRRRREQGAMCRVRCVGRTADINVRAGGWRANRGVFTLRSDPRRGRTLVWARCAGEAVEAVAATELLGPGVWAGRIRHPLACSRQSLVCRAQRGRLFTGWLPGVHGRPGIHVLLSAAYFAVTSFPTVPSALSKGRPFFDRGMVVELSDRYVSARMHVFDVEPKAVQVRRHRGHGAVQELLGPGTDAEATRKR
jgi:hypothetical protein